MPSKVVISSCVLIFATRLLAFSLLLLVCLAPWSTPWTGFNIESFFYATQLILTGGVAVYWMLKIKSLRLVTKDNSTFSVRGFRINNDYKEQALVEVRAWAMRGAVWARLVFETDNGEQIVNTITNVSFLLKPDEFGVGSNLIEKMSWYSIDKKSEKTLKKPADKTKA